MIRLSKLPDLLPRANPLYFQTFATLIFIKILFKLLPSPYLHKYIFKQYLTRSPSSKAVKVNLSPADISGSVGRIGRHLPGSTCLIQALTVKRLLYYHGYEGTIRIGVRRDDQSLLNAHAWVEYNDQILFGERLNINEYKLLKRSVTIK